MQYLVTFCHLVSCTVESSGDKQVCCSTKIADIDFAQQRLSNCFTDVRDWCASRRLQLNASKTELIWFGSHASLSKLSAEDFSLSVCGDIVTPVTMVCDLGVYLDIQLITKQQVTASHVAASSVSDESARSDEPLVQKSLQAWCQRLFSVDMTH